MNFDPQLSSEMAIGLALAAAFLWGSWFISLKHLGPYPLDAFFVTLYATSFALVWGLGLWLDGPELLANIATILADEPVRVLGTLGGGVVYVLGMRFTLSVLNTLGLSVAQPIQSSMLILLGTTVSAVVGGVPPGVSPVRIILGALLLTGAMGASMLAGRWRSEAQMVRSLPPVVMGVGSWEGLAVERSLPGLSSPPMSPAHLTGGSETIGSSFSAQRAPLSVGQLWRVLALVLLSSVLIPAYPWALSFGLRSTTQSHGLAVLPFMAMLSTGAFLGALITSGPVLTRRRQWRLVLESPPGVRRWGVLSGLCHYGGNIIHAFATVHLSSAISWPLGVTSGLWTQAWGLVYGEFRGAGTRAWLALAIAVSLYVAGVWVVAGALH